MDRKTADQLMDAAEALGYVVRRKEHTKEPCDCGCYDEPDVRFREEYSGRGMYGSYTCALVLEGERVLGELCGKAGVKPHFRTDSMGYDLIAY